LRDEEIAIFARECPQRRSIGIDQRAAPGGGKWFWPPVARQTRRELDMGRYSQDEAFINATLSKARRELIEPPPTGLGRGSRALFGTAPAVTRSPAAVSIDLDCPPLGIGEIEIEFARVSGDPHVNGDLTTIEPRPRLD
jgi:hypothetical protein